MQRRWHSADAERAAGGYGGSCVGGLTGLGGTRYVVRIMGCASLRGRSVGSVRICDRYARVS